MLKSEEEVLDAAKKKQVSVVATNIVVNCPVIFSAGGGIGAVWWRKCFAGGLMVDSVDSVQVK